MTKGSDMEELREKLARLLAEKVLPRFDGPYSEVPVDEIFRRPRYDGINRTFHIIAQEILAAFPQLSSQGQMRTQEWLPIESAPKDGTVILIWCVHNNAEYSHDPVGDGWEAPVIARWIDHNGGGWTWHGLCGHATKWTTLPSPPTRGGDKPNTPEVSS